MGAVEEMICFVCVCVCYRQRGIVVMDVICRRFCVGMILGRAISFFSDLGRVRRVKRGSISSELQMCGGGVLSIFLLPLVAGWLETIDVCI